MSGHADTIRRYLVAQFSSKQESDEAVAALDALVAENQQQAQALEAADWLITCLQDIRLKKPVRGLPEAFAAYEVARAALAGTPSEDTE